MPCECAEKSIWPERGEAHIIGGMDALPVYFSGLLAVLLLSAFVKIFTSLTILRYGLGLETAGFGVVIAAVSVALSLVVVNPQLEKIGGAGAVLFRSATVAGPEIEKSFTPFLRANAHKDILERLGKLKPKGTSTTASTPAPVPPEVRVAESAEPPFPVLVSAFLLSELKEAFQLGFMILLPFLVIDLLVANVLMSIGVTQISQTLVSLPLKILLFFVVDGWTLLSEKLIASYL